ncbi:TPR-like protein [Rozella allomycis CSF55]|uniref:DnaJ domain-containing protein n=1 Tax=Rozella allomycis (strain CSF55) TaxID=988480 RepID=A0A075B0G5_ROZAC|nr:DnaJ domain-containing protein [Rozella allomycis CSF55]RKP20075.1 TPR-like protein [Rozella allomycis CSF55]|eukprot:EPZ35870.1 DnaJ domain-containing protein [Rozella allomycis CSF55]
MEATHTFKVGMSCSGCSNAVQKALNRLQGIQSVDISLEDQTVKTGKTVTSSSSQSDEVVSISDLLLEAQQALRQRDYQKALRNYREILELENNNSAALFSRATVYQNMGRYEDAMSDLDSLLVQNPDFESAIFLKAKINLKIGEFSKAQEELEKLKDTEENRELLKTVHDTSEAWDYVQNNKSIDSKRNEIIEKLSEIIRISPAFLEPRRLRVDLNIKDKKFENAIPDLSSIARLVNADTKSFLRLAEIQMFTGSHSNAFNSLSECLRLDQDDKKCRKLYKFIKGTEKLLKRYIEAEKQSRTRMKEVLPEVEQHLVEMDQVDTSKVGYGEGISFSLEQKNELLEKLCTGYSKVKNAPKAIKFCEKAIENESGKASLHAALGEAYFQSDKFEEASREYHKAHELDQGNMKYRKKINEVEKKKKQASMKNYYDILGVPRDADASAIKQAYRKLAIKWHPDKNDENKEEAEKKMAEINTAYRILGDEKLRREYDSGIDPDDPYGGQGGPGEGFKSYGENPFEHLFRNGHGGQFFQNGGGFQQNGHRFHFNF